MATRFIAVWSRHGKFPKPPDLSRREFTEVLTTQHLRLWTNADDDVIPLADSGGAILGKLFTNRPSHRMTELGIDPTNHIRSSDGRHLLSTYWGGYVAFLCTGASLKVIRSPSGQLPCYYTSADDAICIASDVDALVDAGLFTPEIDSTFLARHLYAFDLRTPATCLHGLTELLPGFSLSIVESKLELHPNWTPWDHVSPTTLSGPDEMADHLQATIDDCVQAWAGCYGHILHALSGGLDSSIIAAALAPSGTRTSCITISTDEPEGDERAYAKMACDALHLPLFEANHLLSLTDIATSSSAHLPRPIQTAFSQSTNRTRWNYAPNSVDAYFDGVGGDNVFCHMRSATPILDRLIAKGLNGGLLETLKNICDMTGCSVPDALSMAMRRAARPTGFNFQPRTGFLRTEVIATLTGELTHPWFNAPQDALPGKAVHVAYLATIQGTIDGFPRHFPPLISPLLSQPIMEACLHIPTWLWCTDGQDRSIARKAFANRLPTALIARRSKGTPDTFAFDIVETNRTWLRENLLYGEVACLGIVNLSAVEAALSPQSQIKSPDHLNLLMLAEMETWIRHWRSRGASRASARQTA